MIDAVAMKDYMRADGGGSFDYIEYDGPCVILRTRNVKSPDRGQGLRLYFDADRKETMTGRRFEIMPSDLWLLRAGTVYRFFGNIVLDHLPDDIHASVSLTEDAKDAFGLLSFAVDREGRVVFTAVAFRAVEMDPMVSIARLSFYRESVDSLKTRRGKSKAAAQLDTRATDVDTGDRADTDRGDETDATAEV